MLNPNTSGAFEMYCPKCGARNDDSTKFCRACGENLKVIAQAMMRRVPVVLASKLDAYLERKNERIRRDSIVSGLSGCLFLFLGVRDLVAAGGSFWAGAWLPIVVGCLMLVWSLWDYMVYRRSLSSGLDETKTPPVASTNELKPHDSAQALLTPPSITESTTKHLDAAPKGRGKY